MGHQSCRTGVLVDRGGFFRLWWTGDVWILYTFVVVAGVGVEGCRWLRCLLHDAGGLRPEHLLVVVDGEVALVLATRVGLGGAVRGSVLAEAHDAQLRGHVRALLAIRVLTLLECRLLLMVASLTVHVKDNLLCSKFFQRSLHLLHIVGATIVLLFAGSLGPQFILLGGAQSIQPVLEVRDPLAVQKRLCRCFVVSCVVHLVYHIVRECLVLLVMRAA